MRIQERKASEEESGTKYSKDLSLQTNVWTQMEGQKECETDKGKGEGGIREMERWEKRDRQSYDCPFHQNEQHFCLSTKHGH